MKKSKETSPNTAYTAHFVHPNPDLVGISYNQKTLAEIGLRNHSDDIL